MAYRQNAPSCDPLIQRKQESTALSIWQTILPGAWSQWGKGSQGYLNISIHFVAISWTSFPNIHPKSSELSLKVMWAIMIVIQKRHSHTYNENH